MHCQRSQSKLAALYYALLFGALAYTISTIAYHKVQSSSTQCSARPWNDDDASVFLKGYLEYEPHIVGGLSLHLSRGHHHAAGTEQPSIVDIDTRALPYCNQSSLATPDAKVVDSPKNMLRSFHLSEGHELHYATNRCA